jgi:hypothetical protein
MRTSAHIDINLALNVVLEGLRPTNQGMVSFPAEVNRRLNIQSGDITAPQIRAHRLLYADLTISGSNASYQVTLNSTTPDGINPVGDKVFNSSGTFAYINSNVSSVLTGCLPMTGNLSANTQYLIAGPYEFRGTSPVNDGDIIARLVWTTAAINALGQSNFFCDLILA